MLNFLTFEYRFNSIHLMDKRVIKYKYAFVLVLILTVFLVTFQNDGKNNVVKNKHYSFDSALMFLNLAKGDYEIPVGSTLLYQHVKNDTSGEFEKLSNLFYKKIISDKNDHAMAYYQMIWSRRDLSKVGFDSFLRGQHFAINQALIYKDTSLYLTSLGNLSAEYLMRGDHDSGVLYSKLGYDVSVKANIDRFIFFYSVNMGYVMNRDQLYGAAQMYFEQALKVSKKLFPRNNVLLNNLFSVMITEKNYDQAEAFWKENFTNYKLDLMSYEGQLIAVNRAFLSQNQKRWKEARSWIDSIKEIKNIQELKLNVIRLKLRQIDHENWQFSNLLNENRQFIFESYPYSFLDLEDFMTKELKRNHGFLTIADIEKLESTKTPPGNSEKMVLSSLNRIKAMCYENIGNYKLANEYNKKSLLLKWEFDEIENTLRHTDLSEKLRLSKMFQQIEDQKKNIQEREQEKRIYQAFTLLLILISLLILYTIFKQRKNNNLNEKLLKQEIKNEKLSAETLVRENDLNNRIVTLSKLIISKVDLINKLLSSINESNYNSSIKDVRTEFLNIQNAVSDAQPQLADTLLEDYTTIQIDFPDIVNLGITEKRIFVLSIHGYQTKEIAGLLGLTSQYVNNARTSIRKKLSVRENWKEVLLNKKNPNLRSSE